ncbi:unnamed protein product [Prorocentrum cordatum]|uniref:CID domain-containing protein n=1 Tax=Prorocentrum cordatum TaxID=2364126 RepID=A0ABN9PZ03_9DINO|nr:unnamed protein product [Polarella glacialis]
MVSWVTRAIVRHVQREVWRMPCQPLPTSLSPLFPARISAGQYLPGGGDVDGALEGDVALRAEALAGQRLVEWAGWEMFGASLEAIVKGTQDPAFEPRSIQAAVASCAHGAVRSGIVRQAEVLDRLSSSLSPSSLPEDTAPALRSAIARRARLALACLTDCIAHKGLGPQAGPDAMGLVGQLPRRLFGAIFDNVDDRDRGACAFLGEILQSWDRRKSFSKKWLQEAASKFSMPKGANPERDEGRGWYALTAENIEKQKLEPVMPKVAAAPAAEAAVVAAAPPPARAEAAAAAAEAAVPRKDSKPAKISAEPLDEQGAAASADAPADAGAPKKKRGIMQDEEDDETVAKHLEESRKRRAAMLAKHTKD